MSSNPFDPGSASEDLSAGGGRGGDAPPVDMEVGLILNRCLEIFQNNPGIILGAILLPFIPVALITGGDVIVQIAMETQDDEGTRLALGLLSNGLSIISSLISIFFSLGQIRIFLGLARGQEVDLNMLVSGGPHYLGGLIATFFMGLASSIGCCLLVVPGIILWTGLEFSLYALVDQDLGPIEAMSESWRLTEGYKMTVFLINLVVFIGALVLFCITLGLGYLLAVPILSLMQAVMYQSLMHHQGERF